MLQDQTFPEVVTYRLSVWYIFFFVLLPLCSFGSLIILSSYSVFYILRFYRRQLLDIYNIKAEFFLIFSTPLFIFFWLCMIKKTSLLFNDTYTIKESSFIASLAPRDGNRERLLVKLGVNAGGWVAAGEASRECREQVRKETVITMDADTTRDASYWSGCDEKYCLRFLHLPSST